MSYNNYNNNYSNYSNYGFGGNNYSNITSYTTPQQDFRKKELQKYVDYVKTNLGNLVNEI